MLAERSGLRIHEVPVDWVDDPDSRVDIVKTAKADLAGIARLLRALTTAELPVAELRAQLGRGPLTDPVPGVPHGLVGQALRFGAIGVLSTLAYLVLFLMLRGAVSAQPANLLALLITAVANTAANRRHHLRHPRARAARTGAVPGPDRVRPRPGAHQRLARAAALGRSERRQALELGVLVFANALATLLRFVLFRGWVFRSRRSVRPGLAAEAAPEPTV